MKKKPFNKALAILLVTNGVILIAGAMLGPIYALFVEEIGGDLMDASIAGGVFALAAAITTFLSGKYSDSVKENEMIIVMGYGFVGLGFLLYTLVNSMMELLFIQVLIGFGEAVSSPAFAAVFSKHLDKGRAGREWGTRESINYLSIAVGVVAGGFLATKFGFDMMFIAMGIMTLGSAFYIWFLPRAEL